MKSLNNKIIFIILLSNLMLLTSCKTVSRVKKHETTQLAELKTEMASLNLKNPKADLDENWDHGDKRFIGINGYAFYCPGLNGIGWEFIERYGIRPIDGTSDVIEGNEHLRLIESVTKYAELYNQELLKRLQQH